MERKIVVYGHGDIRPGLGFPTDKDFEQWIKEDIFTKYNGRYHFTSSKHADIIVLSRRGLAYGHFEVEDKIKPNQKDLEDYPDTKFVYLARLSVLYSKPVRLFDLGIKNFRYGLTITESQFDEIKKSVGEMQEYRK
jgi:hypothetical protein